MNNLNYQGIYGHLSKVLVIHFLFKWGYRLHGLTIPMVDNMIAKKIAIKPTGKNWLGTQTEDVRRQLHDSNKAAKIERLINK